MLLAGNNWVSHDDPSYVNDDEATTGSDTTLWDASLATAITFGATAADLFQIDLGYNPPFSTPKDPVHYAGLAVDEARTETT